MKNILKAMNRETWIGVIIFLFGYMADQATKLWAMHRFTNELGEMNHDIIRVWGELFRFQLAFNYGAAFSIQPQKLVPWLHPTLFYLVLSAIAAVFLIQYARKLDVRDRLSRMGVLLILTGAAGNLTDRLRIHKVIDFIDWDFPDIVIEPFRFLGIEFSGYAMYRWPTFNIADALVLAGVTLIIIAPLYLNRKLKQNEV
jgi:signal peptidase II